MTNRLIIICLLVIAQNNNIFSQSLEIMHTTEFTRSKMTPINHPNFQNISSNGDFVPKLRLTFTPLKSKKFNCIASWHAYDASVEFRIGKKDENNIGEGGFYGGGGSRGTRYNYALGIGYVKNFWKSRIRLNPALIQTYAYTTHGDGVSGSTAGIVGPYSYGSYVFAIRGSTFLTSIQMPIYIKLFKGIHAFVEIGYKLGFQPYAYNRVEWKLNGVRQPDVRYEANGTGLLYSYGLCYVFNQKKKK